VIVSLNGPFGVGKTTVARLLVERMPGARIVDPERLGWVMRRTLWRTVDYQDVALWRRVTVRWVGRAGAQGVIVVPMTVVERHVYDELTRDARVFALAASRPTMAARIAASDEARQWRSQNLDRCLEAFDDDGLGERIDTDGRTPTEVADLILARL
jgi:broad-specificity NMP kinase